MQRDARMRLVRGAIACAVFLIVISSGLAMHLPEMVGRLQGHGTSGPSGVISAARHGKVVHELPDGESCRYLAFDNHTGWIGMAMDGKCESEISQNGPLAAPREFKWGVNN